MSVRNSNILHLFCLLILGPPIYFPIPSCSTHPCAC